MNLRKFGTGRGRWTKWLPVDMHRLGPGECGYIKAVPKGEELYKIRVISQVGDVETETSLWHVAESIDVALEDLFEPAGGHDKLHSWDDYAGGLLVRGNDISRDLKQTGSRQNCGGNHKCKGAAFEFVYAGESKDQVIQNAFVRINFCTGASVTDHL